MSGIVTVTFKTSADSEDDVREILARAQQEIDGTSWIFPEGTIGHLSLVTFQQDERTLHITESELKAYVQDAVKAALLAATSETPTVAVDPQPTGPISRDSVPSGWEVS
jgi:hypothetical protein